jgi:hypothetical protein
MGIGESPLVILGGANRYFFIGDLLIWLLFLVVYLDRKKASSNPSPLFRNLLFLIVFCGILDTAGYWKRIQRIDNPWRPQIARWRADPRTTIGVNPMDWPYRVVLQSPPPTRHRGG